MNATLPFQSAQVAPLFKLSSRELHFIQLACSELTYVQIADRMHVSPRTVDGYREALFERLQLKSRVGLALWAVRMGIIIP